MTTHQRVAVVTGASSGIGAATARQLAAAGLAVILGARRTDRLEEVAEQIRLAGHGPVSIAPLDVTDDESVRSFCASLDRCDVLINNAGGALGRESVAEADLDKWRRMYDSNVLGTLRMTKALLPLLVASGDAHIVNVISIAGLEVYDGGAGYTAAKHAERALTETMRLELLGEPVRITDVSPGAVETEFSIVRFDGDTEKAAKVYDGFTPLTADDVAEVITFAVTRPKWVNLDRIVMKPIAQATTMRFDRTGRY